MNTASQFQRDKFHAQCAYFCFILKYGRVFLYFSMLGDGVMVIDNHPFSVSKEGHLMVGGLDVLSLVEQHSTPLYVYDVAVIRENCRTFIQAFEQHDVHYQVAYASKAFSTIAMLQVVNQEGLSLDVVSEGELYTALQANFPTKKIHMHGNNKSEKEMRMAVENNIGCIVIDNFQDIDLLEKILTETQQTMDVLMRVTPGINADTHQYIMTGNEDSKFGFDLYNDQVDTAFLRLYNHPNIHFKGLHCHIGSQINDTEQFLVATNRLFKKLTTWKGTYGYCPEVLNLGGGFGIQYTKNDTSLPFTLFVDRLVHHIKQHSNTLDIPVPEIWIEPGRSIAGNAGLTLYTIGSKKHIPNVRTYVSVDGGMTDNIRPSLYDAKYEGVIANKMNQKLTNTVSIAGKCCESGDMLIKDIQLPQIEKGDIFAVFATGAYGYSMASHYNRFAKPPVIFVENNKDHLVVRGETYQDVVKNDVHYL